MATSTFGVTAESVRRHHFPAFDSFSTTSNPTSVTVGEVIDEEAARLAGWLALEEIDASAITDVTSAAYLQCARIVRLLSATRLVGSMTGLDPELVRAWRADIADWKKGLDEGGAEFLGGGAASTGTSDPDGPTSHINQFSLTQDTADKMSEVVPRLRRDDAL